MTRTILWARSCPPCAIIKLLVVYRGCIAAMATCKLRPNRQNNWFCFAQLSILIIRYRWHPVCWRPPWTMATRGERRRNIFSGLMQQHMQSLPPGDQTQGQYTSTIEWSQSLKRGLQCPPQRGTMKTWWEANEIALSLLSCGISIFLPSRTWWSWNQCSIWTSILERKNRDQKE